MLLLLVLLLAGVFDVDCVVDIAVDVDVKVDVKVDVDAIFLLR